MLVGTIGAGVTRRPGWLVAVGVGVMLVCRLRCVRPPDAARGDVGERRAVHLAVGSGSRGGGRVRGVALARRTCASRATQMRCPPSTASRRPRRRQLRRRFAPVCAGPVGSQRGSSSRSSSSRVGRSTSTDSAPIPIRPPTTTALSLVSTRSPTTSPTSSTNRVGHGCTTTVNAPTPSSCCSTASPTVRASTSRWPRAFMRRERTCWCFERPVTATPPPTVARSPGPERCTRSPLASSPTMPTMRSTSPAGSATTSGSTGCRWVVRSPSGPLSTGPRSTGWLRWPRRSSCRSCPTRCRTRSPTCSLGCPRSPARTIGGSTTTTRRSRRVGWQRRSHSVRRSWTSASTSVRWSTT